MKNKSYISLFNLFSIGIGPSSSHTVGPMRAANLFTELLNNKEENITIKKIDIKLYGSLAFTGKGHKTYEALLLGLSGFIPETINNNTKDKYLQNFNKKKAIIVNDTKISFDTTKNIKCIKDINPYNKQNPIEFICTTNNETIKKTYFSVGGGFIENEKIFNKTNSKYLYNFNSGNELLKICKNKNLYIYELILLNESYQSDQILIRNNILHIWETMDNTIKSGMSKNGKIDNVLNVERRANFLYNNLKRKDTYDPLEILDWINIFAIATCEENASGSKIVTAPTNGAAGIIPAVIKYYVKFINGSNDDGIVKFICTASAIGVLFKNNASISGADMGCQGEVGVACSMAAAGLTAALNGTNEQVENAAEIAMEHNLGLTCDPIKGLVQIPCIERNSMGAIKAINASRLALNGTETHIVSLDQVIKTMYETGKSMNSIFKETSLGGLAVNVVEC